MDRTELILNVEGMTCGGCAQSVRKTIRRLDPDAEAVVDLERGRVTTTTCAQSVDIAQVLDTAGFTATAMTG
jgi:copper chaperone